MLGRAPMRWIEDAEARRMVLFDAETGIDRQRDGRQAAPASRVQQLLDAICSGPAYLGAWRSRANLLKI